MRARLPTGQERPAAPHRAAHRLSAGEFGLDARAADRAVVADGAGRTIPVRAPVAVAVVPEVRVRGAGWGEGGLGGDGHGWALPRGESARRRRSVAAHPFRAAAMFSTSARWSWDHSAGRSLMSR